MHTNDKREIKRNHLWKKVISLRWVRVGFEFRHRRRWGLLQVSGVGGAREKLISIWKAKITKIGTERSFLKNFYGLTWAARLLTLRNISRVFGTNSTLIQKLLCVIARAFRFSYCLFCPEQLTTINSLICNVLSRIQIFLKHSPQQS